MKMNEFDIKSIENYNKTILDGEDEIYSKYANVIIQYLLLGIEKIKNQNAEYVKYILIKGIFTISYVFKILLTYTCNLHLTYHHCQKSYSYYIEFIGQIGDDAVTYLQLNSKDAALFVYKKSIFEIPDEVKRKYTENEMNERKIKNVSVMMDIYNKLIETEITQLDSEQVKNAEFINEIYSSIGRVNNKLFKLYYCCSEEKLEENKKTTSEDGGENDAVAYKMNVFYKKMMHVKKFCDILILKKMSNQDIAIGDNNNYKDYVKMIEYFIKKIRKINDLPLEFDLHLVSKSFSQQFEEKIKLYTSKFINWVFMFP
jgi:hypothetical protein